MFAAPRNSLFRKARGGVAVLHPSGLDILLVPLRAGDRDRLAAHLARLSPEDRRTRFFHPMSDAAIGRYCDRIDWNRAIMVGAQVGGALRGLGELVPDGGGAEIAVTVERDWRHASLGRILVAALLVLAEAQGLRSARLLFLHENAAMRQLAGDLDARMTSEQGVTEAQVRVGPR